MSDDKENAMYHVIDMSLYVNAFKSWKSQSRSYPLFDQSQANPFLHLMKEGEAFKLPEYVEVEIKKGCPNCAADV